MAVVVNHINMLRSLAVTVVAVVVQTLGFTPAEAAPPTPTGRRLFDSSGFINIDCGLASKSYYHEGTNLYYTSDEDYINTGKRSLAFNTSDDDVRFSTLRAFPDGVRNCYTLSPVQPNHKYLIRAWFLYGNYDGASSVPAFDLYVGVDFWVTVTIQSAAVRFCSEIIYVSTSDSVHVCLVNTGHGTPFISVLELRPLDKAAYAASRDVSLRLFNRWDVGPTAYDPADRLYNLTDDAYDRVWFYSKKPFSWEEVNTNKSMDASSDSPYKVPAGVLATAGQQINGTTSFSVTYPLNDPTAKLYAYWHFAELQLLNSNQTREFDILVPHAPAYKFGPIRPTYLRLSTIESTEIPLNGSKTFAFALKKTNQSSLVPILNAAEVYVVMERRFSPTNQQDADAITSIKKNYDVPRIWQGDPCLPINYQWDSLICVYNGSNPPRITALNLASSNLTGELPISLSNLTSLYNLNLSNNGFTGKIPEFLAHLPALKVIDLTRNNLTGPVPAQLAQKARNKSIVLRLEGNPDVCKSFPCEKKVEKRHSFIIPLVALIVLVVISGLILVAFRNREKQVSADQAIKSRNKQFRYSEIVKITNNFRKILGKGAFGSVYYGLLEGGTQVAVKILNNNTCPITIKQFCGEAELLMKIHHINLVSLIGYCDERSNMALVYEYMSNGDLQMHLSVRNEHPLSWKTRLEILIDTAQGLEYLHSGCQPQIIHRDVKPANILLDDAGHAKISDFGLSRYFTTPSQAIAMTDPAGTPGYCDPEYVQMCKLSEKSDVYSFGVVLMELITGQPPLVRHTSQSHDCIPIVEWVKQVAEKGDIMTIIDKRLAQDLNANSAWRLLEIGLECVKPRGSERPRMSEVVPELKLCYASQQIHLAAAADDDYEISGYLYSRVELDRSPHSLLPTAR